MNRYYKVSATVAPNLQSVDSHIIHGSFSFSTFDAAKRFVADYLPTYEVIPGGVPYPQGRRFDAIDHDQQIGASLFVSEVI